MFKYQFEKINEEQYKVNQDQVEGLFTPQIKKILEIIEKYGFEVRIVGGAVRDILLGEIPRDIDLSTNALPDQLIFMGIIEGLEVNTKGLVHGTIKYIIDGEKYEITSLAYAIVPDEHGKPIIESKGTWAADAIRRDFTMNSLSMDLQGNIFDYVGGIKDIENQTVRGNPKLEYKIEHDPVVNLRAYRLVAKLMNPKMSKQTSDTVKKTVNLLPNIDLDKVGKNMMDIIKSPNAYNTLKLMAKWGVLKELNLREDNLKEVISTYKETGNVEKSLKLMLIDQSTLLDLLD